MYSIGEVSRLTGITASTLRYYEAIGLIPNPRQRQGMQARGMRQYDDSDLRFIRFIHSLKQTGMSLEDIRTFTEDGCLMTAKVLVPEIQHILQKRVDILDQHIEQLDRQMEWLHSVRNTAETKRSFYEGMLQDLEAKGATDVQ